MGGNSREVAESLHPAYLAYLKRLGEGPSRVSLWQFVHIELSRTESYNFIDAVIEDLGKLVWNNN